MDENNIVALMVRDHCKIEKLLDKLEENIDKDYEKMKESFHEFEWVLEKHLFTEEKAIFTQYTPDDVSQGYKMLPELTQQHNYIVNKLNNWRDDISKGNKLGGFYEFKKYLIKHRTFEEKDVYPKLDQALNDKQKNQILSRINEMV